MRTQNDQLRLTIEQRDAVIEDLRARIAAAKAPDHKAGGTARGLAKNTACQWRFNPRSNR